MPVIHGMQGLWLPVGPEKAHQATILCSAISPQACPTCSSVAAGLSAPACMTCLCTLSYCVITLRASASRSAKAASNAALNSASSAFLRPCASKMTSCRQYTDSITCGDCMTWLARDDAIAYTCCAHKQQCCQQGGLARIASAVKCKSLQRARHTQQAAVSFVNAPSVPALTE